MIKYFFPAMLWIIPLGLFGTDLSSIDINVKLKISKAFMTSRGTELYVEVLPDQETANLFEFHKTDIADTFKKLVNTYKVETDRDESIFFESQPLIDEEGKFFLIMKLIELPYEKAARDLTGCFGEWVYALRDNNIYRYNQYQQYIGPKDPWDDPEKRKDFYTFAAEDFFSYYSNRSGECPTVDLDKIGGDPLRIYFGYLKKGQADLAKRDILDSVIARVWDVHKGKFNNQIIKNLVSRIKRWFKNVQEDDATLSQNEKPNFSEFFKSIKAGGPMNQSMLSYVLLNTSNIKDMDVDKHIKKYHTFANIAYFMSEMCIDSSTQLTDYSLCREELLIEKILWLNVRTRNGAFTYPIFLNR